jgi:hypothetical protein
MKTEEITDQEMLAHFRQLKCQLELADELPLATRIEEVNELMANATIAQCSLLSAVNGGFTSDDAVDMVIALMKAMRSIGVDVMSIKGTAVEQNNDFLEAMSQFSKAAKKLKDVANAID